jgi:hypothetical protein
MKREDQQNDTLTYAIVLQVCPSKMPRGEHHTVQYPATAPVLLLGGSPVASHMAAAVSRACVLELLDAETNTQAHAHASTTSDAHAGVVHASTQDMFLDSTAKAGLSASSLCVPVILALFPTRSTILLSCSALHMPAKKVGGGLC